MREGWLKWNETRPPGAKSRKKIKEPIQQATKQEIAEWDKKLKEEGLSMDNGRLYEKRTIQFEKWENPFKDES